MIRAVSSLVVPQRLFEKDYTSLDLAQANSKCPQALSHICRTRIVRAHAGHPNSVCILQQWQRAFQISLRNQIVSETVLRVRDLRMIWPVDALQNEKGPFQEFAGFVVSLKAGQRNCNILQGARREGMVRPVVLFKNLLGFSEKLKRSFDVPLSIFNQGYAAKTACCIGLECT